MLEKWFVLNEFLDIFNLLQQTSSHLDLKLCSSTFSLKGFWTQCSYYHTTGGELWLGLFLRRHVLEGEKTNCPLLLFLISSLLFRAIDLHTRPLLTSVGILPKKWVRNTDEIKLALNIPLFQAITACTVLQQPPKKSRSPRLDRGSQSELQENHCSSDRWHHRAP